MLSEILQRLRMVSIESPDPLNLDDVLKVYIGNRPIRRFDASGVYVQDNLRSGKSVAKRWAEFSGSHILVFDDGSKDEVEWYRAVKLCEDYDVHLILVNPREEYSVFTPIGSVEVPDEAISTELSTYLDANVVEECLPALRGLTLKDIRNVVSLTMGFHGVITPRNIQTTRKRYFPDIGGLTSLRLDDDYYYPAKEVVDWIDVNLMLLDKSVPQVLRPRGLLLDGGAGVGKTSGGKYIAKKMGVPCYMISMAGIVDKWLGSSGRNLEKVLRRIEMLSPCVVIFDEIEKLVGAGEDSHEVRRNMLAQLLWWLQEHEFPIMVVMTTNNRKSIPPELFRAGRVDAVLELKAPQFSYEVKDFLTGYVKYLQEKEGISFKGSNMVARIKEKVDSMAEIGSSVSQAELKQFVIDIAKERYVETLIDKSNQ